MRKFFVVTLLFTFILAALLELPAIAQSAKTDSSKKTQTVTTTKSKTKAKAPAKSKKKSKTNTKTKTNTTTKTNVTKSKSKTEDKSKAAAASKKKVTSRGDSRFNVAKVISLGMNLKGTPYMYGGSSPKGFDCSGFTSYVFQNAAGITLPRTSSGQASAGTPVEKADLELGDLVYFNTNGKSISHVGIYVGENNFIHASRTKGITVTSLNDSYYLPRYLGATRIR